jgi:hypothetical protein
MRQATIMTDPDEVSPRSVRLQLVGGGTLPCGNSGAGVWHEGRFIGNLWAMVDRQPGNLASGSLGTDIPTDSCIVARLPYLAALAE